MENRKRWALRLILAAVILAGSVFARSENVSAANVNYTQSQAVNWARNVVGTSNNWDKAFGVQCVDLIRWYTTSIGHDIGPCVPGAAADYGTQVIPTDYYTRYNNSVNPLPGDIFVMDKGAYGASAKTGHVGIIVGVGANSYSYVDYTSKRGCNAILTMSGLHSFTYIIRPHFKPDVPTEQAPAVSNTQNVEPGEYTLVNAGSGYTMNYACSGWKGLAYKPIIMSNADGTPEQRFKLQHNGKGRYSLMVMHPDGGAVNIYISGGAAAAGDPVSQWSYSGSDYQQFYITRLGNGNYILQSVTNTNMVIAAPSGEWHALLQMSAYASGDTKQQWKLTRISSDAGNGTENNNNNGNSDAGSNGNNNDNNNTGNSDNNGSATKHTHSYGRWTDCGDGIHHQRACACGDVQKAPHVWDNGRVTKEASIDSEGIKTYTCTVCGKTKTESIPKLKASAPQPPAVGTVARDAATNGVYKVTANGTVQYTKPAKKKAAVTIPETVTVGGVNYQVTSVAAKAFYKDTKVKTITIGPGIKSIGKSAFEGCKNLKKVMVGKGVTAVSDRAFYKCTSLTAVTIPSKVTKIGKQAFYGCKKLKAVEVKTTKLNSKKVGSQAFGGIHTSAKVKVPKTKLKAYKTMLRAKGIKGKKQKIVKR